MNYKLLLSAIILCLGLIQVVTSQDIEDTLSFRKYDILPAISYSPETKLTLGVIGYRYLDFTKEDLTTSMSFVNFIAVYTTANQIVIKSNWDIFTDGNAYRFRGSAFYNKFPDRNYGIGNDAGVLVMEYELKNGMVTDTDQVNFLRYSINRITFKPVVLKKIKDNLYIGLQADIEHQYKFEVLPDSFQILNQASEVTILNANTLGYRAGFGLNLLWDSRDNILNPRTGSFIEFSNLNYGKFLGSKYSYTSFLLDTRKYYNTLKNHTLAFRGYLNFRYSNDPVIPIRGLSRVGGNSFIRGYFTGTYQDDHLAAFETEYRMPFWNDDTDAPLKHFWKRLGMVFFASGAQVYGQDGNFGFDRFNYAVGGGLRVLFNSESRLNIRIDYAVGLTKDSAGPGDQQTGLYFFLSEAF